MYGILKLQEKKNSWLMHTSVSSFADTGSGCGSASFFLLHNNEEINSSAIIFTCLTSKKEYWMKQTEKYQKSSRVHSAFMSAVCSSLDRQAKS